MSLLERATTFLRNVCNPSAGFNELDVGDFIEIGWFPPKTNKTSYFFLCEYSLLQNEPNYREGVRVYRDQIITGIVIKRWTQFTKDERDVPVKDHTRLAVLTESSVVMIKDTDWFQSLRVAKVTPTTKHPPTSYS